METDKARSAYFTAALMEWHSSSNDRSLPWKEEKDPYKIWLSEIILQQTRAEQGRPYYLRFTAAYPTISDLAAAPEEDVFRLWQGLGYYNRCKNMLATARHIAQELEAVFPNTYDSLLALKGIGPYTAAAIASFAYSLPHAVVDGNVYRVLSRYFGIDTPYDTPAGKAQFSQLAGGLLHTEDSAGYNQAIMDLGATVCTPANPKCPLCPLQKNCIAYRQGMTALLPVRSKKQTVKNRYLQYVLLTSAEETWIIKRTGKDVWQNLYELLLFESEQPMTKKEVADRVADLLPMAANDMEEAGFLKQRLTHQLLQIRFYKLALSTPANLPGRDGIWVKNNELKKYGFPKSIVSFLEKNFYF